MTHTDIRHTHTLRAFWLRPAGIALAAATRGTGAGFSAAGFSNGSPEGPTSGEGGRVGSTAAAARAAASSV